ncbi:hypothetical protein Mpt1_c10120 [Candidatus Methanoplasma termitum]|uniref:Uncharacterized protein n=1 Tax=Candidatus Methanoplasma termitum TaxID=1577791 RepID=A0A0A7LCT5_9ARCH|nr:hypothetical protein [Candidatus Methanoplasma termitum]AIZ56884.1 hypothetical protein Mpt1_c10120 [Candidatus Methanoplasma termitum]
MSEDVRGTIEKEKSHLYDAIVDDVNSPFYKHSKTDVFVAAAAIGYYYKKSVTLATPKQDLFVLSTLSRDEKGRLWIMKAIALSMGGLEVLKDMKEIVKICEGYANYGIDWLYKLHDDEVDISAALSEIMGDILSEANL